MGHVSLLQQEVQNQRFLEAFFGAANLIAADAARLAGIVKSKKKGKGSFEVAGHRMMSRPAVRQAILTRCERLQYGPDDVLRGLIREAEGDMKDFFVLGVNKEPAFDYERALALGKTKLLKRMKVKKRVYDGNEEGGGYEETEIDVELYDAQSAKRTLAQIFGMIIDKKMILRKNMPQPIDEQAMIDKLTALEVPEHKWPHGLLARHRRQVKSAVVTKPKDK